MSFHPYRVAMRLVCIATLCLMTAVASQAESASFQAVTTFDGKGPVLGSIVGPGPNGEQWIYATYGYESSMDVVGFKPEAKTYKVWHSPEAGAKALVVGPDKCLYIGTYFKAHVLKLDPSTGEMSDLGSVPGEITTWQLSLGPDKLIYGCTSQGCKLFCVDPATGTISDLGKIDGREQYARTVCAARDGWVYCGVGTVHAEIVAYSPKTKQFLNLTPPARQTTGIGFVSRGKDGFAYGNVNGKSFRLRNGKAMEIARLPERSPTMLLANGDPAEVPDTYPGTSLPIYLIGAGPDGKVYGSGYEGEEFYQYDPITEKAAVLGRIPGLEAFSMVSDGNKLYIGSYPYATLQAFDPKAAFQPGAGQKNNPANYGPLAPDQARPFDATVAPDGSLYFATTPGSGKFGGALVRFDPGTQRLTVTPEPKAGYGVTSVCALTGGRLLLAVSSRGGQGTQETAKDNRLILWDPETSHALFECAPIPGEDTLRNLTLGRDGLVYGSARGKVFAFDPVAKAVLAVTDAPDYVCARHGMFTLPDGRLVALTDHSALTVSYANGKWQLDEIGHSEARITAGEAVVGKFLYAVGNQQTLLRLPL